MWSAVAEGTETDQRELRASREEEVFSRYPFGGRVVDSSCAWCLGLGAWGLGLSGLSKVMNWLFYYRG
jgi:hypothetical protein